MEHEVIEGASVILSSRYGGDTQSPSPEKLAKAIHELYVEDLPTMTEGDYEEHGVAWLRAGFDDGPMFVIEVTRFGTVRFEEWADQDFETPLAPQKVMNEVPREQALQFWQWLTEGRIGRIRAQNWISAA